MRGVSVARGRPPKPAEQRRREGNAGKRPIGDPVLVGTRLVVNGSGEGLDLADVPEGAVVIGESVYLRERLPPPAPHLVVSDELDDSTDAADLWYDIAALLIDAQIMTSGDTLVLEGLVESILIARGAFADLRAEGGVVPTLNPTSGRAGDKLSSSFKLWRDSRAAVLKIASDYGLTPTARARLGLALGQGRKLAQELDDGLPENPRTAARPDDVQGSAKEIPVESERASGTNKARTKRQANGNSRRKGVASK